MFNEPSFNLDQAIQEWRRKLRKAGLKDLELLNELESHLRDDVEQAVRDGLGAQQAFQAAMHKLGQAHALNDEFEKVRGSNFALRRKLKAFFTRVLGLDAFPSLAGFDATAKQSLLFAQQEAPRLNHHFIGTEHVLLGVLRSESSPVANVLRQLGVTHEIITKEIIDFVGLGPAHTPAAEIPYTPRALQALAIAAREAKALRQTQVGAEHILLGLLVEGDGVAARILQRLGVRAERIRTALLKDLM